MRSRGLKPSCMDCMARENDPEITAWDAITVAAVASTTRGISAHPGAMR